MEGDNNVWVWNVRPVAGRVNKPKPCEDVTRNTNRRRLAPRRAAASPLRATLHATLALRFTPTQLLL